MNANELADKLEIAQGNNNAEELIPEAIAMLRHQQAEIENLKAGLLSHHDIYPVKEHFEDEPQAEELHEIMQSNAELTDEEIAVIGDKCFGTMSYELWLQTNEFARAILRKASEK